MSIPTPKKVNGNSKRWRGGGGPLKIKFFKGNV